MCPGRWTSSLLSSSSERRLGRGGSCRQTAASEALHSFSRIPPVGVCRGGHQVNRMAKRPGGRMIEESTITCPGCSHQATERMPADACQFFYVCKGCGESLKPLAGHCCVF